MSGIVVGVTVVVVIAVTGVVVVMVVTGVVVVMVVTGVVVVSMLLSCALFRTTVVVAPATTKSTKLHLMRAATFAVPPRPRAPWILEQRYNSPLKIAPNSINPQYLSAFSIF